MRPVKVAAAVLAAGFSRRLGRPKQELLLNGATLLARSVRTAQGAGLDPVFVVVREVRWTEPVQALGATVILNDRAHEGMATSVVAAAHRAQQDGLDGLVVITCDQPALRPEHLQALCADPNRITGSNYGGRTGVPAYFPADAFEALQELQGDAGARNLLQNAAFVVDESLSLDIDTEADFAAAQNRVLDDTESMSAKP